MNKLTNTHESSIAFPLEESARMMDFYPGARVEHDGAAGYVTGPSFNRFFTSVLFDESDDQGNRTADVTTEQLHQLRPATVRSLGHVADALGMMPSDLLAKAEATPTYAFPLAPCRAHTFQWEDGERDECYRCGEPKPVPSAEDDPKAWIYHDVPAAEGRAAKSTGTPVTAPCGWTFTPMTPPTRPTSAGRKVAVQLQRCPVCRTIAEGGAEPS
ncbi:hypothetical protein [Arthrobacter rhombi]|uniref:hypothetical protein n=1 Tax=Arthrobacter rhombi TaxID=71253 RepID=UPI003FD33706